MRFRTTNTRRKRPRTICREQGHVLFHGYGFAFGGGIGSYTGCSRCGVLIEKIPDDGE